MTRYNERDEKSKLIFLVSNSEKKKKLILHLLNVDDHLN